MVESGRGEGEISLLSFPLSLPHLDPPQNFMFSYTYIQWLNKLIGPFLNFITTTFMFINTEWKLLSKFCTIFFPFAVALLIMAGLLSALRLVLTAYLQSTTSSALLDQLEHPGSKPSAHYYTIKFNFWKYRGHTQLRENTKKKYTNYKWSCDCYITSTYVRKR